MSKSEESEDFDEQSVDLPRSKGPSRSAERPNIAQTMLVLYRS
jgi:hypothetical protein